MVKAQRFYLENDETGNLVTEILKKIRRYKDGEFAAALKRNGIAYLLNYGVQLPFIRKIAEEYDKNQELANRLWFREIRETMILATLLADETKMSREILNEWTEVLNNTEQAEQLGRNLLFRLSYFKQLFQSWRHHENDMHQLAIWSAMRVYIEKVNKDYVDKVLVVIDEMKFSGHQSVSRSVFQVLKYILRNMPEKKTTIRGIGEGLQNSNVSSHKWLAEELKTELDYLNSL